MARDQESIIIVGKQKTGKTKYALDFLSRYSKRALAIVPDLRESKYTNFKVITINEVHKSPHRAQIVFDRQDKLFLRKVYEQFINGAVIFDDTKFCIRPWNYYDIEDIIGRRRQSNIDTICMYHGFGRIPDFAWDYHTKMVLFQVLTTQTNSKINDARVEYVNKLAAADPAAKNNISHIFREFQLQ